jgi:Protein of unknown function (DUF4199)
MEKVSSARVALKWGLIYGIFSIVFTTVLYNTDLWKNWVFTTLISFISIFGVLYLAMKEFKLLSGGYMAFGEGFGLGTLTLAMGGMLSVVYDFCYKTYIDDSIITNQLEMAREQYESMGMAEEQIEASIEKAQYYSTSGLAFLLAFLFILFIGVIAALIMSAILKKEKSIFS